MTTDDGWGPICELCLNIYDFMTFCESLRRILLQRLIKMSFWNINILFRTKHSAHGSESEGVGPESKREPGILKCESIDPCDVSEPEPADSRAFVTFLELIQTRTMFWANACSKCGADYEYKGLNIRLKMKCAFDTNWQQMLLTENHFHCWVLKI